MFALLVVVNGALAQSVCHCCGDSISRNEVVSCVAHDADAVEQKAADEFRSDDEGIQPEREVQSRAQMLK